MASKVDKSLHLDTSKPETRRLVYEAIRSLSDGSYSIDLTRKRWRVGYVSLGKRKHLGAYVAEFEYRYNSREMKDGDRLEKVMGNLDGRLTYKELVQQD